MLPIWRGLKEVVWSDGKKWFISNLASEEGSRIPGGCCLRLTWSATFTLLLLSFIGNICRRWLVTGSCHGWAGSGWSPHIYLKNNVLLCKVTKREMDGRFSASIAVHSWLWVWLSHVTTGMLSPLPPSPSVLFSPSPSSPPSLTGLIHKVYFYPTATQHQCSWSVRGCPGDYLETQALPIL